MDIYEVHPKNYENKYTTIQCTNLYCPRFGLSTIWCVDVLDCRCFGMSTFLVCFGLSTFWSVDVLDVDVMVCQRFNQSPTNGSTLTHQSLVINMVIIMQTTYPNGFHIPRIMKTSTRLYSVPTCTVHVSVCRRFGVSTFRTVDVLVCRHFWFVLVCRRFGLSTFWMSTFWFVNVLTSHLQKGPL